MEKFLQSIIDRDPAAKSKLSLILTYPGVKAVFFHRIANFFSTAKFDLIARIISQFSRFLTGIEIHIVTILCDKSEKYATKMFNKKFLEEKGLPVPSWF